MPSAVYFATNEYSGGLTFGSLYPRTMYARQYHVDDAGNVDVVRTDSIALGTLGNPGNLTATVVSEAGLTGTVMLKQDFFHSLGGPNSESAVAELLWSREDGFSDLVVTNPADWYPGSTGMHANNPNVGGEWSDFYVTHGHWVGTTVGSRAAINFVAPDGTVAAVNVVGSALPAIGSDTGIPGTGRVVLNEWDYPTEIDQIANIYVADARRGVVKRPVDASDLPADAPPGLRPIDLNGWDWFDALTEEYIAGIGWLSPDDDAPRVWILGPMRGCGDRPVVIGSATAVEQTVRLSTRLPQTTRQTGSSGASGSSI